MTQNVIESAAIILQYYNLVVYKFIFCQTKPITPGRKKN